VTTSNCIIFIIIISDADPQIGMQITYSDTYLWNSLAASGTRIKFSYEQGSLQSCNKLAWYPMIDLHLPSTEFSLIKYHTITPGGKQQVHLSSHGYVNEQK
jgi:hypothetical protein